MDLALIQSATHTQAGINTLQIGDNSTAKTVIYGAKVTADVAATTAGNGVIYLRDNGGGKMQWVARFPTGAIQVLATEP